LTKYFIKTYFWDFYFLEAAASAAEAKAVV
jgi:hypothetical protein